jgi:hypothetical protein
MSHARTPHFPGPALQISNVAASLTDLELEWVEKQPLLQRSGYILRNRYRPHWTPSWLSSRKDAATCEDSVVLPVSL